MAVPVGSNFPGGGVFGPTENLHEAHPAFDQSPSQKALAAKGTDVFIIQLKQFSGGLSFAPYVSRLRCA